MMDLLAKLSESERRVFNEIVKGKSNEEAAPALGMTRRTVETYRMRFMRKLGLRNPFELGKFAVRHGYSR